MSKFYKIYFENSKLFELFLRQFFWKPSKTSEKFGTLLFILVDLVREIRNKYLAVSNNNSNEMEVIFNNLNEYFQSFQPWQLVVGTALAVHLVHFGLKILKSALSIKKNTRKVGFS